MSCLLLYISMSLCLYVSMSLTYPIQGLTLDEQGRLVLNQLLGNLQGNGFTISNVTMIGAVLSEIGNLGMSAEGVLVIPSLGKNPGSLLLSDATGTYTHTHLHTYTHTHTHIHTYTYTHTQMPNALPAPCVPVPLCSCVLPHFPPTLLLPIPICLYRKSGIRCRTTI
jgi:hypothetical protein